ncbi:cbb3-type cytochrome c oxidase subunit 3 [Novosphingobium flavum]|uniref:Cbb3-type cytochrome c oxidase subunit 3 n=1 Tax=Novosphingobium aerophilum TaxID=2839843 RepID=A0A7X1F8G5_9SPHN|nr:cbb3-type cytochrome c oxidase subunit 3 [Novosphingobium aerophilum]MBC2652179.1 cbb3-type cytochrome c oxidase subunit 3 [Novosphingobium aerophilum]MBC2661134.1 cbb3-type cytochrome c oxidase subunit 3 [Novosphingobium aerophilum]
MSAPTTYELLRHLADSWGLLAMTLIFLGLCAWPFRPGARSANETAARMILHDDDFGGTDNG